jgi:hypothetical protein
MGNLQIFGLFAGRAAYTPRKGGAAHDSLIWLSEAATALGLLLILWGTDVADTPRRGVARSLQAIHGFPASGAGPSRFAPQISSQPAPDTRGVSAVPSRESGEQQRGPLDCHDLIDRVFDGRL